MFTSTISTLQGLKVQQLKKVLKEANIQLMIFSCPIYGRDRVYVNHFHVPRAITSTVKKRRKRDEQSTNDNYASNIRMRAMFTSNISTL